MAHLSRQGPNLATSSTPCASPASKTPSRAPREGSSPSATAPVSPTSTSSRFSRGDDVAAAAMQIETLMRAMGDLLARIAAHANFPLTCSPATLNNTLLSWLTDSNFHLPNGDIVSLCCSSLLGLQFPEDGVTAGATADTDGLMANFRPFLLAASLVHAGWHTSSTNMAAASRPLHAAGHTSNYRLLKRLDRILTPQFLSGLGQESRQVLFLLLLGAVLGMGSSAPQSEDHGHSPESPVSEMTMFSSEFQRSPTLWLAMRHCLVQMLAQDLMSLGSMLGIRLDAGLEQRIVDTAVTRWNQAEEVVWADMVGLGVHLRRAELAGGVESEDGEEKLGGIAVPSPPRLGSVACPEVRQFQAQTAEKWTENPKSYLAMFEEPETVQVGSTRGESRGFGGRSTSPPRRAAESNPQPQVTSGVRPRRRPEGKRRSIWLVRPFDAGSERGMVNMYTRLRGDTSMESLLAFV